MNTDSIHRDCRLLVLAPFGKDGTLITSVLQESGFRVEIISSVGSLSNAITEGAGAAIVTEEVLHFETIGALAQCLANQPPWSDFPLIVLTGGGGSTADTESAARARAPLGNVSLLERPLRAATLISSVRTALAARQRQYEVRDHLEERQRAEDALRRAHEALESVVEQRTAALRHLSARLLRVQDEERRRIARELHDSLGQYLTAAKINLDVMARSSNDVKLLREAQQLIDRAIADTRTLSHLLHPPLLDEAGFLSAARWYVEGFGKRSGIKTNLRVPDRLERLPSEIETALFRILQEALTNVHRHSRSAAVDVTLDVSNRVAVLTIRDYGKGMPKDSLNRFAKSGSHVGVGLAGMHERVKEFGGSLQIESGNTGTTLKARVPIPQTEGRKARMNSHTPYSARPEAFAHVDVFRR